MGEPAPSPFQVDRTVRDVQGLDPLALNAVRHAASYAAGDARETYARLYRYGTEPVLETCTLLKGLSDPGSGVAERLCSAIADHFGPPRPFYEWSIFGSTQPGSAKIYISPKRRDFEPALAQLLPAIRQSRADGMKFALTRRGVSRPDKIIVYVPRLDDAKLLAVELEARIRNMTLGRVPFTHLPAPNRFVSIGTDTFNQLSIDKNLPSGSWRANICQLLTAAIANRNGKSDHEMISSCTDALQAHGINGLSWLAE